MFKDAKDLSDAVDEVWQLAEGLAGFFRASGGSPDTCVLACAVAIGRIMKVNVDGYEGDWAGDMAALIRNAFDKQEIEGSYSSENALPDVNPCDN